MPHDGFEKGWVRGPGTATEPGLHIIVGAKSKRKTGAPSVELGETGLLGSLIDPPFAEAGARNRRRLKILSELFDFPATPELLEALVGVDKTLDEDGEEHPDNARARRLAALVPRSGRGVLQARDGQELAKDLKRRIEVEARNGEAEALRCSGAHAAAVDQAAEIREGLHDLARPGGDLEGLEEELRDLESRRRDLELSAARREAQEEQRRRLGQLEEEPDREGPAEMWQAAEERCRALESELQEAREARAALAAERDAAQKAHAEWQRKREALQTPIQGATPEDVERAQAACDDALGRIHAWTQFAALDDREAAARKAERDGAKAAAEAEYQRSVAGSVLPRLRDEILKSQDWGRLMIADDGYLHRRLDDGRSEPFERVSSSGKVKAVFRDIGLKIYRGGVLPIEQWWWDSLVHSAQRDVVRIAVEEGVKVCVEQPREDIDHFRVRHLDATWLRETAGESAP
ncbi:MAG: hypothetical protein AAFX50_09085 [Acidobacteriota bacterium]